MLEFLAVVMGFCVFIGGILLLITLLGSWLIVHPREEKVILYWGKYSELLTEPGFYVRNLWGRKIITVSTKRQTLELTRTTVADGNGNPIVVAAVVTFQFVDSKKVAMDVSDAENYVHTQALAVLKQVAAKYPYESPDGHSLKQEAQSISGEMVAQLQMKVDPAGAHVLAYELSDLSYAPEIAQAMLVRQQAQALVDARKIVVEGAVEIVYEAITQLGHKELHLSEDERSRLVSNLLTVICGEAKVQPTYPIHAAQPNQSGPDPKMLTLLETIAKNTKPKEG